MICRGRGNRRIGSIDDAVTIEVTQRSNGIPEGLDFFNTQNYNNDRKSYIFRFL